MSKKFNKLEKHVEREYEKPSKRAVLRRVEKAKHLKSEKEAAEYIGKAVAGEVYRRKKVCV